MPTPEPTLAEICKTVREMQDFVKPLRAKIAESDRRSDQACGEVDVYKSGFNTGTIFMRAEANMACDQLEVLRTHALALVQAAEQGERYRDALHSIILADKTHYEHHEVRRGDGQPPKSDGGTCWLTPKQIASQALTDPSGAPT